MLTVLCSWSVLRCLVRLITHCGSPSFLGVGRPYVELKAMIVVTAVAVVNESFMSIDIEIASVIGD